VIDKVRGDVSEQDQSRAESQLAGCHAMARRTRDPPQTLGSALKSHHFSQLRVVSATADPRGSDARAPGRSLHTA